MSWIELAGSVAAVLVLAAVASALKLGGGTIDGEAEARRWADAIVPGFDAEAAIVGNDGAAALVRGAGDALLLLKRHGAQVAARPVGVQAIRSTPEGLLVDPADRWFRAVLVKGGELPFH